MDPTVFREWLEIDARLRRAILARDAARRRSEAGSDEARAARAVLDGLITHERIPARPPSRRTGDGRAARR